MIADELDQTRTQTMTRLEPSKGERPGLMTDLEDLVRHAAQVADGISELRTRLEPIIDRDQTWPADIAAAGEELPPAQDRARMIRVRLQWVQDTIAALLDGIRL